MVVLVLAAVVMVVWIATGFAGGITWLERRTGLDAHIRGNAGDIADI